MAGDIFGDEFVVAGRVELDESAAEDALRDMFSTLIVEVRKIGVSMSTFFDTFTAQAKRAGESVGGMGRGMRDATDDVRLGAQRINASFNDIRLNAGNLNTRIDALTNQFRDLVMEGRDLGATATVLAPLRESLKDLAVLQARLNTEVDEFGNLSSSSARDVRREFDAIQLSLQQQSKIVAEYAKRQTDTVARANQTRTNITINEMQAQTVALRNEGKLQAIESQRQANVQLSQMRSTSKARQAILRFSLDSMARVQRAMTDVVKAGATGIGRAIGNLGVKMQASYARLFLKVRQKITIGGDDMEASWRRTMSQQESILRTSTRRQEEILASSQRRLNTGVLGVASRSGGFAAAAGGGLLGGLLLRSGFERASNLERLQLQFTALLDDGAAAMKLLGQVEDYAKRTPFDLVGVADLAKGFLTIGKSAEEVIPAVDAIANAVAFTGGNTENLDRVQRAFLQIVSAGKLQGDELNQLAENLAGLNLRQILADQLTGGDTAQLAKMQEAGELQANAVVNGLLEAFANDKRLQGAVEGIAGTLSGQFDNTKESFEDLGATMIQQIDGPLKASMSAAQRLFGALSAMVSGETTPRLKLLAEVIRNVAVSLGLIVAAKTAIEVIQLMGTAAKFTLTPMGAFMTGVSAIVAILTVLNRTSPDVRAALGNVRDAFGSLASGFVERAGQVADAARGALSKVGDFINRTIVPKLAAGINFLATNIEPAFTAIGGFVEDKVVPVVDKTIQTVRRVVSTVVPEIVEFGRRGAVAVADAAKGLANVVGPYVTPIVSGVGRIVAALGSLVTGAGSFTDVRNAARAAWDSISSQFGPLLADTFASVTAWLSNIGDHLRNFGIDAVTSIPGILEEIAFQVTNVLTDPRLVGAVLAAGVILGGSLVAGIVRGLGNNIRQLADYIADAIPGPLGTILDTVLNNVITSIALAVGGGYLALKAIGAFQKLGQQSGAGFAKGLSTAISTGSSRSGDLLSGLFGGAGGIQRRISDSERALNDSLRERLYRMNQTLRLGGKQTVAVTDFTNEGLQAAIRGGETVEKELIRQVGTARFAGARLGEGLKTIGGAWRQFGRDTVNNISSSLKGVTPAINEGLSGVSSRGAFSKSFTRLKFTLRDGLHQMGVDGQRVARLSGAQIAGALAGALAGATQGVLIGQSDSALSTGLGLASLAGTSLMIGSVNAAAGAATFSVGLLTAAITKLSTRGEETKETIRGLAEQFRDVDITAAGAAASVAFTGLADKIANESVGVQETLRDLVGQSGVDLQDLAAAIVEGGDATEEAVRRLLAPLIENGDLVAAVGGLENFDEIIRQISDSTANAGSEGPKAWRDYSVSLDDARGRLEAAGINVDELTALLDFLDDEISNTSIAEMSGEIQRELADAEAAAQVSAKGIVNSLGKIVGEAVNLGRQLPAVSAPYQYLFDQLETVPNSVPVITTIQRIRGEVDLLRGAYDTAIQRFYEMLNPGTGSVNSELENVLRTIQGAQSSLTGLDTGTIQYDIVSSSSKEDISRALTDAIVQGQEDGWSDSQIRKNIIRPFLELVNSEVTDPALKEWALGLEGIALTGLDDLRLGVSQGQLADIKEQLQQFLNDNPAIAELNISDESKIAALADMAALNPEIFATLSDDPVKRQQQVDSLLAIYDQAINGDPLDLKGINIPDSVARDLYWDLVDAGKQGYKGFVAGLDSGQYAVASAAQNLADIAERTLLRKLRVQSPSRVTMEIGRFVTIGLADGMDSAAGEVEKASARLGGAAVAAFSNLGGGSSLNELNRIRDEALRDIVRASTQLAGTTDPLQIDAYVRELEDAKVRYQDVVKEIEYITYNPVMPKSGGRMSNDWWSETVPGVSDVELAKKAILDVDAVRDDMFRSWVASREIASNIGDSVAGQYFTGLSDRMKKGFDETSALIGDMIDDFNQDFGDGAGFRRTGVSHGENFASGVVQGISSGVKKVADAAKRAAKTGEAAFTRTLGIRSPSTVMMAHGVSVVRGLAIGISSAAGIVAGATTDLAEKAVRGIRTAIGGGASPSTSFKLFGISLADGLADGLVEGMDDLSSRLSDSVDGMLAKVRERLGTSGRSETGGAFADLFEGITSSLTTKVQGVQDLSQRIAIGDSVQSARDLVAQFAEDGQKNTTSLDFKTFTGLRNREAVADAVSSVQELISTMLAAGEPLNAVVNEGSRYIGWLEDQLTAIYGNRDAVRDLMEQLGLSENALNGFADAAREVERDAQAAADATNTVQLQLPDLAELARLFEGSGGSTVNVYPQRVDSAEIAALLGSGANRKARYVLL